MVKRYRTDATCASHGQEDPDGRWVFWADAEARIAALETDCNIMCNALQRIEAGETEPRMIARRTLEHWSEKAALATAETEVKHGTD